MKNLLILIALFSLLSCKNSNDGHGNKKIERIVSLAPNITEILYALKLDDKVVAVSDYCTYPPQVRQKERVGGLFNPNLEKIAVLKPDLILATTSSQQLREKVSDMKIKVVLLPEKTINDIYFSIDSIAVLNGVQNRAKGLISAIKDSLAFYQVRNTPSSPTAILVLGRDAGTTNNIGISGPGTFITELWQNSGGRNAFPDMPGSFAQVNREDLLERNPNIIIEFKTGDRWDSLRTQRNKKEWQNLDIDAVKKGNIYVINGISYLIPGPRIFLLAKAFHQIIMNYNKKKDHLKIFKKIF